MQSSMQNMAPAYYIYNPDPNPEARQHGHFIPQQMQSIYQTMPAMPTTPAYSRPTSSSSQSQGSFHQSQPPKQLKPLASMPMNVMTPMPSPPAPSPAVVGYTSHPGPMTPLLHQQLQHHQHHQRQLQLQLQLHHQYQYQQEEQQHKHQQHGKPSIILETGFCESDGLTYPTTPPLSSTSSTMSSPGSCDMLVTPLNPMFSGLDSYEGLKDCAGPDVTVADKLPLASWTNSCASPPMSPVYIPQVQTAKSASTSGQQASVASNNDLLSVSACPSLSPSPSPYPPSIASEQDKLDFCDPRNLTVSSADSELLSSDYAGLSSSLVEDELVLKQSCNDVSASPARSADSVVPTRLDFETSLAHGLSLTLEEDFPVLESEDEFVNGIVNLGGDLSASTPSSVDLSGRSRACSSTSSATDFECEQLFESWESSLDDSSQLPANKRLRTASGSLPVMSSAADAEDAADAASSSAEQQQASGDASDRSDASDNGHDHDDSHSSTSLDNGGNDEAGSGDAARVRTSRRGRKQSLTEDPSKVFACDMCNRRFRRQEHLKRHYRSLHTQEKPFNCQECGKKFSRSDNLAQHARTHGAGAFVMNLFDDPDMVAAAQAGYPPQAMFATHHGIAMAGEDYTTMGQALFHVAAQIPGSSSDLSSDDSKGKNKKKRKRSSKKE